MKCYYKESVSGRAFPKNKKFLFLSVRLTMDEQSNPKNLQLYLKTMRKSTAYTVFIDRWCLESAEQEHSSKESWTLKVEPK